MAGRTVTGGWWISCFRLAIRLGRWHSSASLVQPVEHNSSSRPLMVAATVPAGTDPSLLMKYPTSTIQSPHRNPIYSKSTLFPHFQLHCLSNLCRSPDLRLIQWYKAIVPDVHGQVVLWLVAETTMLRNFITCLSGFNKWSRAIHVFQVLTKNVYILILKVFPLYCWYPRVLPE